MLSVISRTIGTSIVLGLAAVGLKTVATEVVSWKRSHDAAVRN